MSAKLPEKTEKSLIDSGTLSHMTNQEEILSSYQKFEQPEKVGLGDGRTVDALGIGKVHVYMRYGICKKSRNRVKRAVIINVLIVPKLACNLFSVRAATFSGNNIKFGKSKCWIRDAKGRLCLVNILYHLDCEPVLNECASIEYGIDYDETFSPVVRFPSIRILLACTIENDMLIWIDVVTAFLNGEDIFMDAYTGATSGKVDETSGKGPYMA